jgi:hypothetical protein
VTIEKVSRIKNVVTSHVYFFGGKKQNGGIRFQRGSTGITCECNLVPIMCVYGYFFYLSTKLRSYFL